MYDGCGTDVPLRFLVTERERESTGTAQHRQGREWSAILFGEQPHGQLRVAPLFSPQHTHKQAQLELVLLVDSTWY